MIRHLVSCAALVAALCACAQAPAAGRDALIPQTTAARHGLTRPWYTQVQMDSGRSRVQDVVLDRGTLFVQTDRAMVHAIDAETGRTLWAKQIGRPNHPSGTPGLSSRLLVVVNGSRLYAVNRRNGDLLFETQANGPPGAGAAVSDERAYVPMLSGMIVAHRLKPMTDPLKELGMIGKDATEEEKTAAEERFLENLRLNQEFVPPLTCQSLGRAMVQPLVTTQNDDEELVTWTTDRGYMNVGRVGRRHEDRLEILYRLETSPAVATRPAYIPPDANIGGDSGVILVTARDGFVQALLEKTGQVFWRFSAGGPMVQSPVAVDDQVFVTLQLGGMYCLDAKSGRDRWWAPQIVQFIAASNERVYAADKLGRIQVLNAKTGARLDSLPAVDLPIKLANADTDRLYLATETGLIQCLHEVEQAKPLLHNQREEPAAGEEKTTPEGKAGKKPASKEPPEEGEMTEEAPPGPDAGAEAGGDTSDPFGGKAGGPGKGGAAKGKGGAPKGGAPKGGAPKGGAAKGGAAKGGAAKGGAAKGGAKGGPAKGGDDQDPDVGGAKPGGDGEAPDAGGPKPGGAKPGGDGDPFK